MYIPFGRTVSHRLLGRTADFCPLCRGFQPFQILQVDSIRHFYALPLGGRNSIGQSKVCESCSLLSTAHPEIYRGLSSDFNADLESLIAETKIRRSVATGGVPADPGGSHQGQGSSPQASEPRLLREPFEMASDGSRSSQRRGQARPSQQPGLSRLVRAPGRLHGDPADGLEGDLGRVDRDGRRHRREALAWPSPSWPSSPTPAAMPGALSSPGSCSRSARSTPPPKRSTGSSNRSVQAKSPLAEVLHPRDLTNALLERWD